MDWEISLLNWFNLHQRILPWRSYPIPYHVWISEMMLQQTQVQTVIPYFERFFQRFPTIQALAQADLQDVLKVWEGLGYYARARNLHKAAQVLVRDYSGQLPSDYVLLQSLPGIGPYSAAAIVSIAFSQPIPVVDGNVVRVFSRFWGIWDDIRNSHIRADIFKRLEPSIQRHSPSLFNQAMMELGALICVPTAPLCDQCPLKSQCFAALHDKTRELPVKSVKPSIPHYEVAVGIIWNQDRFLISKRHESSMLGGLWELPGGKCHSGETLEAVLHRKIQSELGLTIQILDEFCRVKHAFTHFKMTLIAFECHYLDGKLEKSVMPIHHWIGLSEIEKYPFATATKRILEKILGTS